jgi:RsiW-degrading membrane proteinase PrsW (M82 family)
LVWLRGAEHGTALDAVMEPSPARAVLREDYNALTGAGAADPWKLARWVRRACMYERKPGPATTGAVESGPLQLAGFALAPLLERHLPDPVGRELLEHYLTLERAPPGDARASAAEAALRKAAGEQPPPALANQWLGQWLVREGRTAEAARVLAREGGHFAGASAARSEALHWAVREGDRILVVELVETPGWLEGVDPALVYHAAAMAGRVLLQWRTLFRLKLRDIPYLKLAFTLFAGGLWVAVLLMMSGERGRWRRRLLLAAVPILLGVASIWPTLSLLALQERQLGFSADAEFPGNLWNYLAGVGLREELCKLALFAFLLPVLVRRGDAGTALVAGALVGLGFAVEENLQYYDAGGGGVVWARLVTANFIHLALTGIAAHGLYQMVRTGFHDTGAFITSFAFAVLAHGFYDFALTEWMDGLLQLGILHLIVLAAVANRFFGLLEAHTKPGRAPVSPAGVFVLGSAVLVAGLLITAAWQEGTMKSVADVGQGCLGLAPVGFLFWRHLHR